MKKDLNEVHRIERLTQQYFNNGDLRNGLKTYRTLLDEYSGDSNYYRNYITFLLDESVVAELLWPAYEEAIACCNRAITKLPEEDREYFYTKKAEVYVMMSDSDRQWFSVHHDEIISFVEAALEKYPENIGLLKCSMSIYRIASNSEKYEQTLNLSLLNSPNDFMLLLQKIALLEKNLQLDMALSLLENWIKSNPSSSYLKTAYGKIIQLYHDSDNSEMADTYQDLLDNL